MTDEYYQKKRLEEMQKQTECMVNQNKLLADIRDTLKMGVIAIRDLNKADFNVKRLSDFDVKASDKAIKEIVEQMEKRWSE